MTNYLSYFGLYIHCSVKSFFYPINTYKERPKKTFCPLFVLFICNLQIFRD